MPPPPPRTVKLAASGALGVVLVLSAVRALIYTAAASTPFQHTTATFFTLVALFIAAAASLGARARCAAHFRALRAQPRAREMPPRNFARCAQTVSLPAPPPPSQPCTSRG